MKDYYQVLGLERGASLEEITQRWMELKKGCKAGLGQDGKDRKRLWEINEAYRNLKKSAEPRFDLHLERYSTRPSWAREKEASRGRRKWALLLSGILALIVVLAGSVYVTQRLKIDIGWKDPARLARMNLQPGGEPPFVWQSKPEGSSKTSEAPPQKSIPSQEISPPVPRGETQGVVPQGPKEISQDSLKPISQEAVKPAAQEPPKPLSGVQPIPKQVAQEAPKPVPQEPAKPSAAVQVAKPAAQEPAGNPSSHEEARPAIREALKPAEKAPPAKPPAEAVEAGTKAPRQLPFASLEEKTQRKPYASLEEMTKRTPGSSAEEAAPAKAPGPALKPASPPESEPVAPDPLPPQSQRIPWEQGKLEPAKPPAREVSPPPARKPENPAKPSVASLPPPPPALAGEQEVRRFFARYLDQYNRKDLQGFISSFSPKAVQNQKDDLEKITNIYRNFFDQMETVQYRVSLGRIEPRQDRVEVKGQYELDGVLARGGKKLNWKGQVQWVLTREDGRLKILSLNYQPQPNR